MKFTYILLGILCLLCLFTPGNTKLVAQQTPSIEIAVTNHETLLQNWRPDISNEPDISNDLTFAIEITVPTDFNSGKLVATLQNVTQYAGKSGNVSDPNDKLDATTGALTIAPDLGLDETTNWTGSESQLSYALNGTNKKSINLTVNCYDSAAYGELALTASGSGYTSNTATVKIPKDDNGNQIADCWQNDATMNYGRDDDNDTGPNTRTGDNITVINEYRGFHVNESLTDTDPNGWDVFVKIGPDLAMAYSISGAYALPMTIHEAPWVNMVDGYVFPYEIAGGSGGPSPSVYAIRLQQDTAEVELDEDDNVEDDNVIDNRLGSMYVGPPSVNSLGTIYTERLSYYYKDDDLNTIRTDYINAVIAHEIGHAVNLGHCPCLDDLNCYMWNLPDDVVHHENVFASHHNGDYNLVFDGYFWPRIADYNAYYVDRIYVEGVGIRARQVEDVNADGVVNASDLVIIALNFGTSVPHIANVNGDDAVNILDLVRVANAMTTTGSVCFTSLREDVNADGVVNILDLIRVVSELGSSLIRAIPEDVNADGKVNETDLNLVADAFGNTVATSSQ